MTAHSAKPGRLAEPVWDIATLFPAQGSWSEEEYLALATNHLVEFSHGLVEVLPMPTHWHQIVVRNLLLQLMGGAAKEGGTVLFAPLRVRLWPGKFREPDLVYMAADHQDRIREQFWDRADLVVEVVSPDDAERDRVHKRREYAEAGIPEFWLVDLESETVTVLRLHEGAWQEHGVFARGTKATSATYPSLQADVDVVFGRR